jgi:hypothetical protein
MKRNAQTLPAANNRCLMCERSIPLGVGAARWAEGQWVCAPCMERWRRAWRWQERYLAGRLAWQRKGWCSRCYQKWCSGIHVALPAVPTYPGPPRLYERPPKQ